MSTGQSHCPDEKTEKTETKNFKTIMRYYPTYKKKKTYLKKILCCFSKID